MTHNEKKEFGFDVREIPKITNESIDQQKNYSKKYMKDKTRPVIKENVLEALTNIKNKRGLVSTNDTIKFLCDIEKKLTDLNMIQEIAKCPDCGATMSAEHTQKVHSHVDKNSECFGCLEKGYTIKLGQKIDKEVLPGTKEAKIERNEQTDTSDDKSEEQDNIPFEKWTKEEMEEKLKNPDLVF